MSSIKTRVLEILNHERDVNLLHWAFRKARTTLEPSEAISGLTRVLRVHPELAFSAILTLQHLPWSDVKGPVGAILFDTTLDEELRAVLWILWAQNEAVVPTCPNLDDLDNAVALHRFPRAEALWYYQLDDDDPDYWSSEAEQEEPDVEGVVEAMLRWPRFTQEHIWERLTARLGDAVAFFDVPDAPGLEVLDPLSPELQHYARRILAALKAQKAPLLFRDSLLFGIEHRTQTDALPLEDRIQSLVIDDIDHAHLLATLPAAIEATGQQRALFLPVAPLLPPHLYGVLFPSLEVSVQAPFLNEVWSERPISLAFFDTLVDHPELLKAIAPTFLRGPNAARILEPLADAPPEWASPLLLEEADALLETLEDEENIWNAVVGMADPRLLPLCERYQIPWHTTRAWAWITLAKLTQTPLPAIDPDWLLEEESLIDHPLTLRVECNSCHRWTTHPVSGISATMPQLAKEAGFEVPDGWDGVMPNEVLTCPGCGAIDDYTVPDDTARRLQHLGSNRSLLHPHRPFPTGLSATPRIFADQIATRPSRMESAFQEQLAAHDTPTLRSHWLAFLFQTNQRERLRTEATLATTLHPDSGAAYRYLALVAEQLNDPDGAITAAYQGLKRDLSTGGITDLLGILSDIEQAPGLEIRWSYEGRTLRGVLSQDVPIDEAVHFIHSIAIVEIGPAQSGEPGWVERWIKGERPISRAEQRAKRLQKKAKRKKSKTKRRR